MEKVVNKTITYFIIISTNSRKIFRRRKKFDTKVANKQPGNKKTIQRISIMKNEKVIKTY